ncbi:MAG: T9SS type A sorting domain-containing protein, partial [Ekhidna sp.]|nr:T9SS type A sorting domain-containing protein [Ekhidna sp.]
MGAVTVTNDVTSLPITQSTTITWTYRDATGNTVTQTQQVTIADNTPPMPDNSDLPMLEACSQIASLTAPTATDNCDGTITATIATTPPITTSTTLTWTYRDAAGNTSTQTQEVTIGDTEAPMPELSNLPVLTGECPVATMADLTAPTATDNCDDGTITATTNAGFPITASTTITWTYTDATGNTSTQTQAVICPLGAADEEAAVIFPNPSGRYLEVRSSVEGTFKILSLSGKPLLEGTTNTQMDIASLQSGLYLVQLPDGRLLKFVRE